MNALKKDLVNIFMFDNHDKNISDFRKEYINFYYSLDRKIQNKIRIDHLWGELVRKKIR